MMIAVTSTGQDLDAAVDSRFGRCKGFVLVDSETGEFKALSNEQNLQAPQGAGIQSAQKVVEAGAQVVLTGHCGPKAFQVLTAGGVHVCNGAQGTVRDAVAAYKDGTLTSAQQADVPGHWV